MSAIEFVHPDGRHSLIVHAENSAIIRIETAPVDPGWIEVGYAFNDSPILVDTEEEWDALVEMVLLADKVQKQARKARKELEK